MALFNRSLFPTPAWLAKKMIDPLDLRGAYIADPEAGSGNLLDAIAAKGVRCQLYAIEIEPELRSVLSGKGYAVIWDDFLTYQPTLHFNIIVMNPPFDRGEDHLLHAWQILYEGEIVCLLSAASLEGKSDKERLVLKLIADHGSAENVGRAFAQAERPTQEEIVLIRLSKRSDGARLNFDVHNDRAGPDFAASVVGQEVALRGFVNGLLEHFNASVAVVSDYITARMKLERYAAPFQDSSKALLLALADTGETPQLRYNTFVAGLQERAWARILDHPRFQSMLTERARKMVAEFRARQQRVDFNAFNLNSMFEELLARREEMLTGAVLDAFDTMTEFHEYNRVHAEGWKTDLAWKVNKRVILPYYLTHSGWRFSVDYRQIESLNDIDRAMCVLTQRAYDDIVTVKQALEKAFETSPDPGTTESTFFYLRFFKKGTLHMTFKDSDLWTEFNLAAAKGRNWIGPG